MGVEEVDSMLDELEELDVVDDDVLEDVLVDELDVYQMPSP